MRPARLSILSLFALAAGCAAPVSSTEPEAVGTVTGALNKGTQLTCDATGTNCDSKNMPILLQTAADLDPDVAADGATGCYATSVVMVASSVLANRSNTASLAGTPTAQFLAQPLGVDATGKPNGAGAKRTSWMYRNPWGFAGMTRDFGAYTYSSLSSCAPTPPTYAWNDCGTEWNGLALGERWWMDQNQYPTAAGVERLLDDGYGGLIAFFWAEPVVDFSNIFHETVTYKTDHPHKIAFSGYQPGAFPLKVNDPGSGTRTSIKLGTKVAQQTAVPVRSIGPTPIYRYTTEVLPNGAPQWPYMDYVHDATVADKINLVELLEFFQVQ
jgi:hypothetical protein